MDYRRVEYLIGAAGTERMATTKDFINAEILHTSKYVLKDKQHYILNFKEE